MVLSCLVPGNRLEKRSTRGTRNPRSWARSLPPGRAYLMDRLPDVKSFSANTREQSVDSGYGACLGMTTLRKAGNSAVLSLCPGPENGRVQRAADVSSETLRRSLAGTQGVNDLSRACPGPGPYWAGRVVSSAAL